MLRQSVLLQITLILGGALQGVAVERSEPSLREVFADAFPIGMGIGPRDLADEGVWSLVRHHSSQVTIENHLKPSFVQRKAGVFTFERANALIDQAEDAGLRIHGHALLWHRSSPSWMNEDDNGKPLPAALARQHLREHILQVVGQYRERIHSWDVVNEALADGEGDEDFRDSPWFRALGPSYVAEAFRAAAEAHPEALLFYNDYGLETEPKRSRAVRLIEYLRGEGVRVDGIGIQAHLQVGYPSLREVERTIETFAAMGLLVHISELDISVHPWRPVGSALLDEDRQFAEGLSPVMAERLSKRYEELFTLFHRHHEQIWAVTFWNTHDGRSWLNDFPVKGRVDHPLLFARDLQPKAAFNALMRAFANDHRP